MASDELLHTYCHTCGVTHVCTATQRDAHRDALQAAEWVRIQEVVSEPAEPAPAERGACTCPHGERSLGRLYGVSMGRGVVRLSTTPGCPEHDSCRHYDMTTTVYGGRPYCPIHGTKGCPATDMRVEGPVAKALRLRAAEKRS